ncbi:MAG: PEGA domain-containing protein [Deltaproteobacteria bacterium]|nr:PEGA domain-containing protein [Deltaproteobacteria bacterium]
MSERFGNYELLDKMAVGGMSEIFLARSIHGRGVEKNMVIKRIHPTLSTDQNFVAMFIEEARLGVSMVHGNIVPVFDFGCVDGYYFLAMEYVSGQNLADLSARVLMVDKMWPVELAAYIVMEVLEGLEYAHKKRDDQGRSLELVHRDVSPSNILLSSDGQVKLLDFGIARSEAREFKTRTGVIKGKPGYMSPEQAAGKTLNGRADVWSCGAVLYELAAGSKLKEGRKDTGDPALEVVLDRALVADPEERFQGAREMQTALADFLAERSSRPTSGDLSDFFHEIDSSDASAEDWDMQSTAVEKHVAKVLAGKRAESPDRKAETTEEFAESDQTTQLSRIGKNRRFIRALFVIFAMVLVAGTLLWLWSMDEGESLPKMAMEDTVGKKNTEDIDKAKAVSLHASLNIVSIPAGATVFIDGRDTGKTTPATIETPPGKHTVALTLAGRKEWSSITELVEGEKSRLSAVLVPPPPTLKVLTRPEGARVFIDGAERGSSPMNATDLSPGTHKVVARFPERPNVARSVELVAGEETKIELVFKEKAPKRVTQVAEPAVISINSNPWSNITLDGKPWGTTPILNRKISPGKHRIVMTNPVRNLTRNLTFSVKPGENKRIREILDKEP